MSRQRRAAIALVAVVAVLVALRAAAPFAIQRYVERTLDRSEGYEGGVRDVDLSLLRGAYRIEGIEVRKTGGRVPVPLFSAEEVDLSVEWSALLHGELVGEVWLRRPAVNFVDGPEPAADQTGEETNWAERVSELFPVRIDKFVVEDGSVHFRAPEREPPVDVALEQVQVLVRNLTNVREESAEKPARVDARAAAWSGTVEARMALDPLAPQPEAALRLAASDVDLVQLNDFLRAYAGFDVQRGRLQLLAEVEMHGGRFEGYVKPLIDDLDVLRVREEHDDQSPLATLWEASVGALAEAFENQPHDRQASRIPIEGRLDAPRIGLFAALRSVVRNAFVQAIEPRFEGAADLE